ncbi:MAG: radical SAM protein [Rhodospirillaceae bacterium]|nr:radical SAM protein [Rhodospirillaceae bacterium]
MILLSPIARALGIFQPYVPVSVPMGLGYVAGYLEEQGEPIVIYDEEVHSRPFDEDCIDYLVSLEKAPPPYVFGFSNVTAGQSRAEDMARLIRKKYPESLIVMGGVHPTLIPDDPLDHSPTDIVVIGQGEQTMWEVLKTFRSDDKNFDQVEGIAFRRDGEIIKTSPRTKFLSLNEMPDFPYHFFEEFLHKYDLGWVVSSYGCPFDCVFCSQRAITGVRVSYSENEKVINQIRTLVEKYGVDHIWFADDNLSIKKKRILSLCDDIVKSGLHKKCSFDAQTRADGVNEEILAAMKRANFRTISYGIEVATDRLMKMINKSETVEDCERAIKMSHEAGLDVAGTFIFGWPTETDEDRKAAFDLALRLDMDTVRFNNATPYPGTALYDWVKNDPGFNPGHRWKNMNTVGALVSHPFKKPNPFSYCPSTISEKRLRKIILRYNFFFALRPRIILKLFKNGVNLGGHFTLPKKWYFQPKEILVFMRFCFYTMGSIVRSFV